MTDIASQLSTLDAQRADLLASAKVEREDLLDKLATLCRLLGPLARKELPDGILRTRERKAAKAPRVREPKAEAA